MAIGFLYYFQNTKPFLFLRITDSELLEETFGRLFSACQPFGTEFESEDGLLVLKPS